LNEKFEVEHHDVFEAWLEELENSRNNQLRLIVTRRLDSLNDGNLGKHKSVGGKVSELIVDFGPGYRIYYTKCAQNLIILLCAGNKSEQKNDIKLARMLAKEVRREKKKRV